LNARTLSLPPAMANLRDQGVQAWRALAPRERLWLMAALLVVGLFVGWLVLVQPAWRTARDAPVQLDQLDAQLQQMRRMAGESRELRAAVPVAPAQAAAALKAATERLGDKARISLQGERATLTLTGVSAESLRAWLGEARSAARARPLEAQLTRAAQGYSGTLVVAVGGTP